MMDIWIVLVMAHAYGDFLLQTDGIAKNKHKVGYLALHIGIHGGLAYLLLQQWHWWWVLPGVALPHALIDFVKSRCGSGSKAFAADQFAHLLLLGLSSWVITLMMGGGITLDSLYFSQWLLIGAGFTTAVWGVGYFIREVVGEMCAENENLKAELGKGLKNGGAMIGKLERALIFVFVAIGQPAGIGFLVAAKSILRFEEAKKQPLAEYVLIGTLWSFGLALTIAYLTLNLVK
jgi:hypothetical protein